MNMQFVVLQAMLLQCSALRIVTHDQAKITRPVKKVLTIQDDFDDYEGRPLEFRKVADDTYEYFIDTNEPTFQFKNSESEEAQTDGIESEEATEDKKDHKLRLIVWNEAKLVFAPISKNANTDFCMLLNNLNGMNSGLVYSASKPSEDLNVTKEAGWKWSVFVRDPIDRFLSAFLDKCVVQPGIGKHGKHCPDRRWRINPNKGENAVIERFEQCAEFYAANPMPKEGHWMKQIDQVTMLKQKFHADMKDVTMKDFDFVGQLSGNVNGQVHKMLQTTGTEYNKNVVDKLFPTEQKGTVVGQHNKGLKGTVVGQHNKVSPPNRAKVDKSQYFTKKAKEALLKMFSQEYIQLGMKDLLDKKIKEWEM